MQAVMNPKYPGLSVRVADEGFDAYVWGNDFSFEVRAYARADRYKKVEHWPLELITPYRKCYGIDPEEFASYRDAADSVVFMAYLDDQPVGHVVVSTNWNGFAHIDELAVHAPARRQQRPQRVEQLRLDGSELGHVAGAAQPAHVGVATHDARGGAGGVEHYGVKGLAGAVRGKPVVWAARIGAQHLGVQVQALQGVGDARAARGIHVECREGDGLLRAGTFQQVGGFATRGSAGIEHAQRPPGWPRQALQQQGRGALGRQVLH